MNGYGNGGAIRTVVKLNNEEIITLTSLFI